MRKTVLAIVLAFLLFPKAGLAQEQEVYIALGDSLAAGQTPFTEIDAGYTDFIALQLMRTGKLARFSKELAFPGYRVQDVMAAAQSEQAGPLLKEATLITISAGANNLLPLIAHHPQKGTLAFNQLNAQFALHEVRTQMGELLALLNEKAPKASIYIVGYYFPYVSVHEEQMEGAEEAVKLLNAILQQEALKAGQHYVEVYEAFEKERAMYLPNMQDVHPNQLGYRIMANEMLKSYSGGDALALAIEAMPEPSPKTFEELLHMQRHNETPSIAEDSLAWHQPHKPKPIAA